MTLAAPSPTDKPSHTPFVEPPGGGDILQRMEGFAASAPHQLALVDLDSRGQELRRITRGDLWRAIGQLSRKIAALPEGPVLVNPAGSIDFAIAFLGALHAGRLAITAPDFSSVRLRARALEIAAIAQPALVLTSDQQVADFTDAGHRACSVAALQGGDEAPLHPWPESRPAFVQYSSGSMAAPRGIAITHGNLSANQQMIAATFAATAQDVVVTWLPRHHDMGLIGSLLHPLWVGIPCISMPPMGFVQRPIVWLRAAQTYGGTIFGAPSFGYSLCQRRIDADQAATLDLSRIRIAFCGSEPIDGTMLAAFAARFAPAGFAESAILPCYGMAEATLLATTMRAGQGIVQSERGHVSCGSAPPGASFALRDPESGLMSTEVEEGEICISGPHVSPGLWSREGDAIRPFDRAFVQDGKRWLRTGDLGYRQGDSLFPVDRLDDALTIHGRTLPAADLENQARYSAPPGTVEAVAVFGVDRSVVVLLELARNSGYGEEEILQQVIEGFTRSVGIGVKARQVPRGSLPRTSSGKIKRAAARAEYLSGLRPETLSKGTTP